MTIVCPNQMLTSVPGQLSCCCSRPTARGIGSFSHCLISHGRVHSSLMTQPSAAEKDDAFLSDPKDLETHFSFALGTSRTCSKWFKGERGKSRNSEFSSPNGPIILSRSSTPKVRQSECEEDSRARGQCSRLTQPGIFCGALWNQVCKPN